MIASKWNDAVFGTISDGGNSKLCDYLQVEVVEGGFKNLE